MNFRVKRYKTIREKNKSILVFLKALGSRKLNQILNKKGCLAGGDIITLVIFHQKLKGSFSIVEKYN